MLSRSFTLLAVAAVCLSAAPHPRAISRVVAVEPERIDLTKALPSDTEFEALVRADPVAALDAAVRRYHREVKGFRATFHKQERIGGKLREPEVIRVAFRDEPFSVLMLWEQGGGLGQGTLYVRGENGGQMKVWVSRLFTKSVDPRGSMPRDSARYGIEGFGLGQSTRRAFAAWEGAKERGELRAEYLGRRVVPDLGRECHVVKRTCPADEIDGFTDDVKEAVTDKNRPDSFRTVTLYLDCETWLQIGTEQHRSDGELVARYFFRDVQLNPPFDKGTFTTASFKR
jgi:hypothetical protein